jgi:hypothetical protein
MLPAMFCPIPMPSRAWAGDPSADRINGTFLIHATAVLRGPIMLVLLETCLFTLIVHPACSRGTTVMRFYWEGYAEVLHLVTTSRTLPPPMPVRHKEHHQRGGAMTGLRRLWRAMTGSTSRRPTT